VWFLTFILCSGLFLVYLRTTGVMMMMMVKGFVHPGKLSVGAHDIYSKSCGFPEGISGGVGPYLLVVQMHHG